MSDSYRNPIQRRNDSGEIDVFEAARYFSGAACITTAKCDPYCIRNGTRTSLGMPKRASIPLDRNPLQKQSKENEKYRQPSSPGARLASFLISLFNQRSLKNKKKKPRSSAKNSDLEDQEIPVWLRRKRRSSLGYFRATNVTNSVSDLESIYSAPNSVITTPYPKANTPTKSCKEISGKNLMHGTEKNELYDEKRSRDYARFNERFAYRNGICERTSKVGSSFEFSGYGERFATSWGFHDFLSEAGEIRKFSDANDHGTESDSSSDLFDLPSYGSKVSSRTGLPVYETTKLDQI